jgi:hypothetical protein
VKEQKAANGRRAWLPQEDETIRKMFDSHSYVEIAQALGRHKGSIGTRAVQLGLRKADRMLESRVGTIVHPRPGVLVHYAKAATK